MRKYGFRGRISGPSSGRAEARHIPEAWRNRSSSSGRALARARGGGLTRHRCIASTRRSSRSCASTGERGRSSVKRAGLFVSSPTSLTISSKSEPFAAGSNIADVTFGNGLNHRAFLRRLHVELTDNFVGEPRQRSARQSHLSASHGCRKIPRDFMANSRAISELSPISPSGRTRLISSSRACRTRASPVTMTVGQFASDAVNALGLGDGM